MHAHGDRVEYFDRNVDRWLTATIVGEPGERHGFTTYGCTIDAGQRPELPGWMDADEHRSAWGYADQFRSL